MKLSIFTAVTDPTRRQDTWREALECYTQLADEVTIVNGGREEVVDDYINMGASICEYGTPQLWPKEFSWEYIGQQFQYGYELCMGDWVIHCDLDFIFHEKNYGAIRQALKDYHNSPAVSFYKWQFILPDRYNLKSRLVIAVNKAKFGDRIKFNGGGDLCQPTLDGHDINIDEIPQAQIPFYNYEKLTKTKEQITEDVERMDRAYKRHFGQWLYSDNGKGAYEGWYRMEHGRFQKPQQKIALADHPKVMQETIKNLTPEQFGYNGFGMIDGSVYDV